MSATPKISADLETLKDTLKACMRLETELHLNPEYVRRGFSTEGYEKTLAASYATIDKYTTKAQAMRWLRSVVGEMPSKNEALAAAVDKVLRESIGRGFASFQGHQIRLVRRVVKSGIISTEEEYDVIRDYVSDEDGGTALWNAAATILADYECKVSADRSRSVQENTLEQTDANGAAVGKHPRAHEPKDD